MKRDNLYLIKNQFAKGNKPNCTSFKKGVVPWNKGLKGIHLSPKSEWKKGQKGRNWIPVNTVTQRKDKNNKLRNWIKIQEPNKSIELARYNWIKKYGKIIKGDIIHHLDRNTLNDCLWNLIALPRTDHPIFHNRWGIKKLTQKQLKFYKKRYFKTSK